MISYRDGGDVLEHLLQEDNPDGIKHQTLSCAEMKNLQISE